MEQLAARRPHAGSRAGHPRRSGQGQRRRSPRRVVPRRRPAEHPAQPAGPTGADPGRLQRTRPAFRRALGGGHLQHPHRPAEHARLPRRRAPAGGRPGAGGGSVQDPHRRHALHRRQRGGGAGQARPPQRPGAPGDRPGDPGCPAQLRPLRLCAGHPHRRPSSPPGSAAGGGREAALAQRLGDPRRARPAVRQ
ncbi:hypothetical protein D3C78_1141110 [compost metagenome]